ncbi:TniQ family protein [Xanthomonas arboricola]|uniref:TniQ family protein n=1 Tax=Xanthomonas arboricola TaxID=56448 RepID=UPI0009B978A3
MTWGGANWCAHPRIHEGESFSSWLHRSAQANGVGDHSFCRQALGERASWNRDIDRFADTPMLLSAAQAMGEQAERLHNSVIASVEGRMFTEHRSRGELTWVLPVGMRNRKRRAFGQQYCPECLSDSEPWLRLKWRFAWMTVCTIHHVALHDACSRCGSPILLHRMSSHPKRGLLCSHCGERLAGTGQRATQRQVRFQRRLERAVDARWMMWCGVPHRPLEIFTGLRALTRGLYTNSRGVGLVELMPRALYRAKPLRAGLGIEHWRIEQRSYAMEVLRHVLMDWPNAFLRQAREHRLYRGRFDADTRSPQPAWLEAVLQTLERPVTNFHARWAGHRTKSGI